MTFAPAELAAMQDCQAAFMADACQVGTIATTQDAIGDLVAGAPSYAAEIACGVNMTGGLQSAEYRMSDGTIVKADAVLRLPFGTVVGVMNVVKITKRQGTAITPAAYEVMGIPAAGPTGIVCHLRAVTT